MCSLLHFWIPPEGVHTYAPTLAPHYTGPPPIDILPDSVLTYIFEFECDGYFPSERSDWRPKTEKANTRNILRVCKRWYILCQPLLYRNIRFDAGNGGRANKAIRCLHRTLEQRPDLRSCTRRVLLEVINHEKGYNLFYDVELISQMLRWWRTSLKTAAIYKSKNSPEVRPIFLQLSQLLCLQDLRLDGNWFGLSISFFLKHFQSTHLESLAWSRAGWLDDTDVLVPNSNTWPGPEPIVNSSLEGIYLPSSCHFTANLKKLTITEPYSPPAALEILLKWPAALESLSISTLHSKYARQYTASALEKLLEIQSHSLRSVHIGSLYRQDLSSIPDISNLSQLRDLALSYLNIFKTSPATACWKLAGPQLRCLTIGFSTEDQHDQSYDAANREIGDWLVEFARLWKIMNHTCHNLERIEIDFNLPWHDLFLQQITPGEGVYWPWQHMEEAKKQMHQYGIRLTWPMDHLDEQSWKAEMKILYEVESEKQAQYVARCKKLEEQERNSQNISTDDEEESSDELYPQHHDPSQRRLCCIWWSKSCVH